MRIPTSEKSRGPSTRRHRNPRCDCTLEGMRASSHTIESSVGVCVTEMSSAPLVQGGTDEPGGRSATAKLAGSKSMVRPLWDMVTSVEPGALPNGPELSKIPRLWREAARWKRADSPSFSRTTAGQAPHPMPQPTGSAEGPGALPGLQRIVGQRHRVSDHPIHSTVQGAEELPEIRREDEGYYEHENPDHIPHGFLRIP